MIFYSLLSFSLHILSSHSQYSPPTYKLTCIMLQQLSLTINKYTCKLMFLIVTTKKKNFFILFLVQQNIQATYSNFQLLN